MNNPFQKLGGFGGNRGYNSGYNQNQNQPMQGSGAGGWFKNPRNRKKLIKIVIIAVILIAVLFFGKGTEVKKALQEINYFQREVDSVDRSIDSTLDGF